MEPSAHSILSQWESFYVIVGSSGAGLTGLMFVVITLAADSSVPRTPETLNAFGTPNVIHFVAVLFIAAVSLLLLGIGIHNAWDTVTYLATQPRETDNKKKPK